ncbi:hypothetical protein [Cupriavidus sp. 2SB]|uniref:hypothetical protein n=1 Tax=Cupriavidus sp. 2SB TaxID=2502199 RepID=UPI0010F82676|nr:hypothetical protein [Cupriavidus sp. 2SB]
MPKLMLVWMPPLPNAALAKAFQFQLRWSDFRIPRKAKPLCGCAATKSAKNGCAATARRKYAVNWCLACERFERFGMQGGALF